MEALMLRRAVRRWRQQRTALQRRVMRDSSDPLAMDEKLFIQSYRVTKDLFQFLCATLMNWIPAPQKNTAIPIHVKILTTLNFLATGSYQKPVGRDWLAPVSQSTASRCITQVVEALNNLLATHVCFPTTEYEKNKVKLGFYQKHGMPGVLGCVDGTLVAIIAPRSHPSEAAFFSRKGYHAINTAIICDSDLRIIAINAKFGGAAHDSFVWRSWTMSSYMEAEHNAGHTGYLLGDSGYPQKPWLMTPILHAAENTPEAYYTEMHVRTRVSVERCIGLLKSRWRCLLRHRVLHYEPTKCGKIINACAILHNLCLNDGISFESVVDDDILNEDQSNRHSTASLVGDHARQQLVQSLWEARQ